MRDLKPVRNIRPCLSQCEQSLSEKSSIISCPEGQWRSLSWLYYVLRITECDTAVKCNQITSPQLQKISQPLYQVEANPIKCLKTFVQRISISNLSRFVITKEAVAWLIPENWISRGIWARREHWALPFLLLLWHNRWSRLLSGYFFFRGFYQIKCSPIYSWGKTPSTYKGSSLSDEAKYG